MIRIPGEIDKTIMDGKVNISLNKGRIVTPVSLEGLPSNKNHKTEYGEASGNGIQEFQQVLDEEIKKISSK